MTTDEISTLLPEDPKYSELPGLLQAMVLVKNGKWDEAHTIADRTGGLLGDWVHAYLHRIEGDLWNANYWYRRAKKVRPDLTIDEEWDAITSVLLKTL